MTASSGDTVFGTVCLVPNTSSLQLFASGSTSVILHPDTLNIKSLSVCFNGDIEILQLHQHLPQNYTSENTNFSYKYHPLFTLCTGDLLFISTMFGKDGMSHYWCPYCQLAHKDWSEEKPADQLVLDHM